MKYNKVKKGIFIRREKRFTGYVELDGEIVTAHVKQTGRCAELLIPGVTVYLETATNPNRKTKYTLISVIKPNGRLVNIDSQIPNKMVHEALDKGLELPGFKSPYKITPESTYGGSRFDFKLEQVVSNGSTSDDHCDTKIHTETAYVEVKGVTLEEDGVLLFPDAPTERGLKHVNELIDAKKAGYNTFIVFVIQMDNAKYFTPNREAHDALAEALIKARDAGVQILAFDSVVTENSIELGKPVKVVL